MKDSMEIDGSRLRTLLAERGLRQNTLAERTGASHFTISRWCAPGLNSITVENAKKVAAALGCTVETLNAPADPISQAEAEWLSIYRGLSPLEQAKARIALEEWMSANLEHRD